MRLLPLAFFFLLCFIHSIHGSPAAGSSTPQESTTDSASSAHAPAVSEASVTAARSSRPASSTPATHKPTQDNNSKHGGGAPATTAKNPGGGLIPSRTSGSDTTHAVFPSPTESHAHDHPPRTHRPSIAALVFEILGVLAGVLALLGIVRCVYIYRRTPARDRIAAVLHRHQLQREMEELERNGPDFHRRSLVEPPPPPYLRPPSYEDEHTPLSSSPSRRGSVSYPADAPSHSPPPRPPDG